MPSINYETVCMPEEVHPALKHVISRALIREADISSSEALYTRLVAAFVTNL